MKFLWVFGAVLLEGCAGTSPESMLSLRRMGCQMTNSRPVYHYGGGSSGGTDYAGMSICLQDAYQMYAVDKQTEAQNLMLLQQLEGPDGMRQPSRRSGSLDEAYSSCWVIGMHKKIEYVESHGGRTETDKNGEIFVIGEEEVVNEGDRVGRNAIEECRVRYR